MNLYKFAAKQQQEEKMAHKDFRDISQTARAGSLQTALFKTEFRAKISEPAQDKFERGYLNPDPAIIRDLKSFFADPEISIVTSNIIGHKISSHRALDPIYMKNPAAKVDQFFYLGQAGDSIPDRLQAVIAETPDWIRRAGENRDEIKVVIPGSGPGRDIIAILAQNPDLRDRVKAVCIDNELDAVSLGQELAEEAGVHNRIEFVHADFMQQFDRDGFDLALMVGIICPLGNRTSAMVVGKISSHLRNGGIMLVSSAMSNMLTADPVSAFVMYTIGWRLEYKTDADLDYITGKAGLRRVGSFYDPKHRFHQVVAAQK
jgi:hypothetical protein